MSHGYFRIFRGLSQRKVVRVKKEEVKILLRWVGIVLAFYVEWSV
jgi:hypothetical protein